MCSPLCAAYYPIIHHKARLLKNPPGNQPQTLATDTHEYTLIKPSHSQSVLINEVPEEILRALFQRKIYSEVVQFQSTRNKQSTPMFHGHLFHKYSGFLQKLYWMLETAGGTHGLYGE